MYFVPDDTTIYREMIEHLKEWRLQIAILLGCALLCVLFGLNILAVAYGTPLVVSCIDDGPGDDPVYAGWRPAVDLEISSNRAHGQIVERHALGCTWYFHDGTGRGDD